MIAMAIRGGAELGEALRRIDATVRADLLEAAVVPQADAVADLARGKTRSRRIASSIRVEIAESDDQHIDVLIGPDNKLFWATFEEFGTRSRETSARARRVRSFVGQRKSVVGGVFTAVDADIALAVLGDTGGIHPGTTGHPFLRPAMDERAEIAVQQIGVVIGDALEQLAVS